jgi:hypothetical protein
LRQLQFIAKLGFNTPIEAATSRFSLRRPVIPDADPGSSQAWFWIPAFAGMTSNSGDIILYSMGMQDFAKFRKELSFVSPELLNRFFMQSFAV